jgi:sec-independent protein translocase protein TatC
MAEEKEKEKEMGFLDHLEELRWRLIKSVVAVVVIAIAAFCCKDFIFDEVLLAPKNPDFITYRFFCKAGELLNMTDELCITDFNFTLQNISMAGQFSTHMTVSLLTGLVVGFPFIFYQLWAFIRPGLREKEQKMARGIVLYASLLFLLGILFGYYVLAPLSVQFL